jgi:Domain of unknown function (DUF4399)
VRGRLWAVVALTVFSIVACGETSGEAVNAAPTSSTLDDGVHDGPTIMTPANGEVTKSPVHVTVDPGDIDPTGRAVAADRSGRFHLLVDQACVRDGDAFPAPTESENHFAFDVGSTELSVDLPVGSHELCVEYGNAFDLAEYAGDTVSIRVMS